MRLKFTKLFTILLVATNLCFVYFTLKYLANSSARRPLSIGIVSPRPPAAAPAKPRDRIQSANRHIKKMLTVVFRDVHFFDNDLRASIETMTALIPAIQVLVVYDAEPYPPLEFVANLTLRGNVQFVSTAFDVFKSGGERRPLNLIRTRYTLLVPDSWRLGGRSILQKMLREIDAPDAPVAPVPQRKQVAHHEDDTANTERSTGEKRPLPQPPQPPPPGRMLIVPFSSNQRSVLSCCRMNVDLADWTIEYVLGNGTSQCDMYMQKHGILVETAVLREMSDPLRMPFPEMLYVQAKLGKVQKRFLPATMMDGRRLFVSYHNRKRKKDLRRQQFKDMYSLLQIKKVIRKVQPRPGLIRTKSGAQKLEARRPIIVGGNLDEERKSAASANSTATLSEKRVQATAIPSAMVTSVEYFGCERNTASCIGPVFNGRPQFVHMGRHTPPCCAEKLRSVVHRVLDELENVGIRHWLDNVALRSAIDTGGLAVDAFEVDISVVAFDLERSESLRKCQIRPLSDEAGFYWMKATDGHYFRVLYSKANQVGVNLLPFELQGDRVVPNGFWGWKAKEFSAEFLHPMSSVVFLGKGVMCPNNVKEFLAIKNL